MRDGPPGGKLWNAVMVVLLVGSVALVFWYETLVDPALRRIVEWVDLALILFFVAEWYWRVLHAPAKGRYAARQSWELLGMIPLIAPLPGFLRILRLVRLVRILRVFETIGRYMGIWERIAKQGHVGKVALAGGSVTLLGGFLVWLLERDVNPRLENFSEAIWWAIVTVTTVGYGDITPQTSSGRVIAAGLMITGIGTIGLLASTLASALISERAEQRSAKEAADGAQEVYAPVPARAGTLAHDLAALASLRERGHLTDAEYELAKRKVLGTESEPG